jgi:ABC-type Fe3+/spermidine/putrescine transport system ATPase subunit
MTHGLVFTDVVCSLDEQEILHAASASVPRGSYACVLGASGAGKSTLLRCIAGLIPCTGRIRHGEQVLQDGAQSRAPHLRKIGFLFQALGLWPELSAAEHLLTVLNAAGIRGAQAQARMEAELADLGLAALKNRRPGEMSGGERQRLALARATVHRPELLLLDEPTSSVDQARKREVRTLLYDLCRRTGATVLHVTHDHEEAFELADHLICMDAGRVVQEGAAADVHAAPSSVAVAQLLGSGSIVSVTVGEDGLADSPLGRVRVSGKSVRGAAWALVRPEHLELAAVGDGVPLRVRRRLFQGGGYQMELDVAGVSCRMQGAAQAGTEVWVRVRGQPPVVEARSV